MHDETPFLCIKGNRSAAFREEGLVVPTCELLLEAAALQAYAPPTLAPSCPVRHLLVVRREWPLFCQEVEEYHIPSLSEALAQCEAYK